MRTWVLVLIALASGAASAATVWKWVDEMGQVHYSDRPVEGAQQIELQGAQTFSVRPPAAPARPTRSTSQPRAQTGYQRFEITSPGQQETLWNIGAVLTVQVDLEPPLQAGHTLDVYLDGQRRALSQTAQSFAVPEVHRGTHTLQAVVVGPNGEEIVRSATVTFMVQQTSILNPNNPNVPGRAN